MCGSHVTFKRQCVTLIQTLRFPGLDNGNVNVLFSACASESQADLGSPQQSSTAEADQSVTAAAADASPPSHFAQYVLHPPLPAVIGNTSDQLSAIPLLLNPDILQSSKIPVITPQLAQVQDYLF